MEEPRAEFSSSIDEQREFLLRHARHPSNGGDPLSLARQGSCKNPLCGDAVDVGIDIDGDLIAKIKIRANGCGISTASASLMTEFAQGKSRSEILSALHAFNTSLADSSPSAEWPTEIAALQAFAGLRASPTRVPCALIAWYALKSAL